MGNRKLWQGRCNVRMCEPLQREESVSKALSLECSEAERGMRCRERKTARQVRRRCVAVDVYGSAGACARVIPRARK